MEIKIEFENSHITKQHIEIKDYTLPRHCPLCESTFAYKPVKASYVQKNDEITTACLFFCPACDGYFLETKKWNRIQIQPNFYRYEFQSGIIHPTQMALKVFSENINAISPSFVDIYHQAEIAELKGLNQICGMGYRKSLEFLIKDYAIKINPDDSDIIRNKRLSEVINDYIPEERIRATALATVWIGNDEAHYVRKHDDKSLVELKEFIEGVVYFIEMDSHFRESKTFIENNSKKGNK